ncbi:gliding motility-associated C-terminal domain-containing protein [Flavobacterium sp. D33]|nr:gliding motility-associated C-terminal domain-containing protein [Flavobacterium selenitireducens]MBD3582668.1 gliding motility-associated C-terminal domain-containing protein [Flavobacterium selenitireducens]
MNPQENSYMISPSVLTSTSANFTLGPDDEIEAAYLYWAGCGFGDFSVKLNATPIVAERTFSHEWLSGGLTYNYFSAFADVTSLVQNTGNGNYTLSELDVSDYIGYAFQNRTNFAGWAIVVVYKNDALPLNQLNVYDGMQSVPYEITIMLDSLNVIDNVGAKIGFLAWEGDRNIANLESLSINEDLLSNALNPEDNAFNGTNTFTNSENLYNMDLDVYNIQGNINIGDTTAEITLKSNQDVVMVNAIVTKLNSQLPDATIAADNLETFCNSQTVVLDYTVYNVNSTDTLPANTPIAFYLGDVLLSSATTQQPIAIGSAESGQITLTLPNSVTSDFTITLSVDDIGNGTGIVTELNEGNNGSETSGILMPLPEFNQPQTVFSCNKGLTSGIFDFSGYYDTIGLNPGEVVTFHHSLEDAENGSNEILDAHNFHANATPYLIYFRIQGQNCFNAGNFELRVRNCPPKIYNFISSNGDGINDYFHIDGLRDIFMHHKISVFNRWGALVWTGNNNIPEWDGRLTKGLKWSDGNVPDGTYYYVLDLNDPDYPEPFTGFLYITQ